MSSVDEKTLANKIRGWKDRRIQKAKSESEGINMTAFTSEEHEIDVPTIEQGECHSLSTHSICIHFEIITLIFFIEMNSESKCDSWRCPGFMQAYFTNKRSRQFHCLPLFTAVTYICVPCEKIIDSLLESDQQPVLSF